MKYDLEKSVLIAIIRPHTGARVINALDEVLHTRR